MPISTEERFIPSQSPPGTKVGYRIVVGKKTGNHDLTRKRGYSQRVSSPSGKEKTKGYLFTVPRLTLGIAPDKYHTHYFRKPCEAKVFILTAFLEQNLHLICSCVFVLGLRL